MKRNTLDRQIIKALAIGISATIAMQPVTVFANETDGTVLGRGRGGSATLVSTGEEVDATVVDGTEVVTPETPDKSTVDTVGIEDEDVALASSIPEEVKSGFSWWWLLILAAITGVSVEEVYRRKKAKEEAEKKN